MDTQGKLLFSDSGKDHPYIDMQWISIFLILLSNSLFLYARFDNWRLQRQFYWLWEHVPTYPFFLDLMILAVMGTLLTFATGSAIRKMELSVYETGIEGYGFRKWGLLPRTHRFLMKYDEIEHIKYKKRYLSIRGVDGTYTLFINHPDLAYWHIDLQKKK